MVHARRNPRPLTVLALAAGLLSAAPTLALAQSEGPPHVRASYLRCVEDGQGIIEKAACLDPERSYQDQRLNQAYKKLSARLGPERRAALVAAQRAWLDFHAKESALEEAVLGSEQVSNMQLGENEIFRLAERANRLEQYLEAVYE